MGENIAFHIFGLPNRPNLTPKFKVGSYCAEREKEEKQSRLEIKEEPSY